MTNVSTGVSILVSSSENMNVKSPLLSWPGRFFSLLFRFCCSCLCREVNLTLDRVVGSQRLRVDVWVSKLFFFRFHQRICFFFWSICMLPFKYRVRIFSVLQFLMVCLILCRGVVYLIGLSYSQVFLCWLLKQ